VENVRLDETWFFNNDLLTGTYDPAGTPPAIPDLEIVNNKDGTGVTVTMSNADVGTTNMLRYVSATEKEPFADLQEISNGDTIIDVDDSAAGYYFYVQSTGSGGTTSSAWDFSVVTSASQAPEVWADGFRAAIRAWLLSIAGVASQVGDQVIYQWPLDPPQNPTIIFTVNYESEGDYSLHIWKGTVEISLINNNPDDLDKLMVYITNNIANESHYDSLSTAKISCEQFELADVGADELSPGYEGDTYFSVIRTMTFSFLIKNKANM